ncbi:MAG: LysR substrate-binding domain-containing protein [Pseudorhodobacter sp.]|nr:LysR substrate-binding domain-containing protein [Pseudorhodobacter sp.]
MPHTIPPFAALRAFEAMCRLGRQGDAADELHISISAISHQIRALETFLGVALFARSPTGLVISADGKRYYETVGPALETLSAATLDMVEDIDEMPLKIHMFQSLANMWFIPHLKEFIQRMPDQQVIVLTSPEQATLSGTDIDAMIVYAQEKPPTAHADLLFCEVIIPVCSPAFLHAHGPIESVEAIIAQRLISSSTYRDEWKHWTKGVGSVIDPHPAHLFFDNRSNALEAAREGIGIAMDRRPFGELQKARGLLIEPLARPVPTGWSYYFVASDRNHHKPRIKKMRAWLLALCADFRVESAGKPT